MRFQTVWSLQLRQAEVALKDGRLDEAYELLRLSAVREHRRGQTLATQLVQRLKQRVAEHLAGNRLEAALRDCDRAGVLGGNQVELAALKEGILDELNQVRQERDFRRQIQLQAHEKVSRGDLSLGQDLCERLPDSNQQRHYLSAQIQMQRQAADKQVARAEAALARNAIEDAIDALKQARSVAAYQQPVRELIQQTVHSVAAQVRQDLEHGQLDQAQDRISLARELVDHDLELSRLSDILQRCQTAAASLRQGDLSSVRENLRILANLMPRAAWIETAHQLTEQALEAGEALRTGPLSLIKTTPRRPLALPTEPRPRTPIGADPHAGLSRFLIQVDGGGRFLAFRKPWLRLGRPRHQAPASIDVALQGSRGIPEIRIERTEDDYFLTSTEPVRINDQTTNTRLLADGDRIDAGARCSIKFRLPCPASRTALLQFSGARLDPPDVRSVILIDDAFLIGPDAQCHVRVRQLRRRFVVLCRHDRMSVQPAGAAQESMDQAIGWGELINLDGASLLIHELDG